MKPTISAAAARRIALAAQGFGAARPTTVGSRTLTAGIQKLGLLQIDSVNVFERSHYIPLFSRFGNYERAALDALTFASTSAYVEYWAHEAALIPVESWPLFRWRMEANRAKHSADAAGWVAQNGPMMRWLLTELAEKGPLPASRIVHDTGKGQGGWWGWSDVKRGLEYLFLFGDVVSAGRTRFERTYGLTEQQLPPHIVQHDIAEPDAVRELMSRSARAHGIGTLTDFADYFRLKTAPATAALGDLVDSGELLPVAVEGWNRPAWLHRDARMPRKVSAAALLSPFDPVVWRRERAERLFNFRYRIEIYTPQPKRVFGYYSLPLLIDDRIVGRVDLKSDRQNRVLRVQSAWSEVDAPPDTAARLAGVLRAAATWQNLDSLELTGRGNLSEALAAELK